jgi:hypothetical protein
MCSQSKTPNEVEEMAGFPRRDALGAFGLVASRHRMVVDDKTNVSLGNLHWSMTWNVFVRCILPTYTARSGDFRDSELDYLLPSLMVTTVT